MRRYLLLLIIMVMMAGSLAARTFVLVAGVSNYRDDEANVGYTTAVAKEFAALMKNHTKDVSIVTSRYANRSNIVSKLTAIANRAQAGDRIIFYYVGHGEPGGLYTFDGTLPYSELTAVLGGSKAAEKYCFIDACHSGSASMAMPDSEAADKAKILFFTACRPAENTIIDPLTGGTIFSASLMQGLQGKSDADGDRRVTAIELFKHIYGDVGRRRNAVDGKPQHPQLIGPKSMHDNVILDWNGK